MLKKRIIGTLTIFNDIVVQSIGFNKYLPIGKPAIAVEFLNQWGIDEIIVLDISATSNNREPNFDVYQKLSSKCNVPLTIGGGIKSVEHVRRLLNSGADKVSINSYAIQNPKFIAEAAHIFGDQCIIVSVDVILHGAEYFVYDHLNKVKSNLNLMSWINIACEQGAGELFINSVDNDGQYKGFDILLAKLVSNAVHIPVIICGGAGKPEHFLNVLTKTNVAAAAAGNYFQFTEHSVNTTKSFLKDHMDVRLETYADYIGTSLETGNRLVKRSDEYLEQLLYQKIEREII